MAKLRLNSSKFAKKLTGELVKNLRLDLKAEGGQRRVLNQEFDEAIKEKAVDAVWVVGPIVDQMYRGGYVAMLDDVANQLTEGFPNPQGHNYRATANGIFPTGGVGGLEVQPYPGGWHPLSHNYWRYKQLRKPGSENLFWKFQNRSSTLQKSFRQFATTQAKKAGYSSSKEGYLMAIGSQQFKAAQVAKSDFIKNRSRQNTRFRITFAFTMPEITQSTFKDLMFRRQFVIPEDMLSNSDIQNSSDYTSMRKAKFNEVLRPWIRARVIHHGFATQALIDKRVRALL